MGRSSSRSTTRASASSSRISASARRSIARSSPGFQRTCGLADIARAAADREGASSGHADARQSLGAASLRRRGGDRPHLLDERDHRHAELRPAHRAAISRTGSPARRAATPRPASRRAAHRVDVQRRAVRRRARRWPRSTASASATSRVGTGNTERLVPAVEQLRPRPSCSRRRTPPTSPSGNRASRGVDRRARPRRGRAGRRRAGASGRMLEAGLGREGHRGDGHRRHRRLALWGECEEQDGMHLGARGFVHIGADRPGDGPTARARGRRERRARAHASPPPGSAAPPLPHARPRRSYGRARVPAAAQARACAASAAPTTC